MPSPFAARPPRWLIPLLGSLVALGPLSIDMYLPALPAMAQELQATQGQMQYTLGVFFAGFCFGMLVYGPLSDRMGRRKLLLSGGLLFTIASLLCTQVTQPEHLILLRAVQAFGSSAAVVMARAIARDVYAGKDLPRVLSLMTLVTMIAPLLAPQLGGLLLTQFSWRAIFALLAIIGCISGAIVLLVLPETLPVNNRSGSLSTAFSHYGRLLVDRKAMGFIGTLAFSFAGMFAFISGSPFVYINYFHIPAGYYGLLFALNVIGMILMLLLNVRLLRRYSLQRILFMQSSAQLIFGVLLLLCHQQSLAVLVLFIVLFISQVNAIGANSLSLLLTEYGERAGSASALAISLQFGMGALASLAVSFWQSDSPLSMAGVMAACAALSWLSYQIATVSLSVKHRQMLSGERNNE